MQALLLKMIEIDDITKLEIWNKELLHMSSNLNYSYSILHTDMVKFEFLIF